MEHYNIIAVIQVGSKDIAMALVNLNDVDMYYEEKGEGYPLILIAGLMSDSQSWLPACNSLAGHYRVIMPDNRGAGRTVPSDIDNSIELMAGDIIALADYLGLEKFAVLGHSMGGFVAQTLALQAPDRIELLILEATGTVNSATNNSLFQSWLQQRKDNYDLYAWYSEIFEWIFSPAVTDNSVVLKSFLDYSVNYPYPQGVEALAKQLCAIENFDMRKDAAGISQPVLVIGGELDRLFPVVGVVSDFSEISRHEISIISGAAHAVHVEKMEEFVEAVCAFLDRE